MAVRLLAFFCALVALAGLAFAGRALHHVLTAPPALTATAAAPAAAPLQPEPQPAAPPAQGWPALFGTLVVAEPQPPTPPQPPAPPAPPAPPISSLGFTLKGTVSHSAETWAILSHPTGERILRVGDMLADGLEVVAIDDQGLWVQTSRGRELLEISK